MKSTVNTFSFGQIDRQRQRRLGELVSVGPAIERDLAWLGIRSVGQLARQSPHELYARLQEVTGQRQDPCVLDAFQAAVAQAVHPDLPPEQRQWWYWSRIRLAESGLRKSKSRAGKIRDASASQRKRRNTQTAR